jgi:hypothetical protein
MAGLSFVAGEGSWLLSLNEAIRTGDAKAFGRILNNNLENQELLTLDEVGEVLRFCSQ